MIALMLSGLLALTPSAPAAAPAVCTIDPLQQALMAAGKLTQDDIDNQAGVDVIRCGDVNGDGIKDALFTIGSGGTAGDVRFGVVSGQANGVADQLLLWKSGYKVGVALHNKTSFDVLQPHYGKNDANCCPSSFREYRETWNGTHFKAGKSKSLKTAPKRFYR